MALTALFEKESAGEPSGSGDQASSLGGSTVVDGLMTFDLIAEQKRLMATPDADITAIDLELTSPSGRALRRRVWVSSARAQDPVIRIEHVSPASGSAS